MARNGEINLAAPITIGAGLALCYCGLVSWWVFLLIFLSHVKITAKLRDLK